MNELRPHGRELLEQACRERTPDAATRERVFAALMATEAVVAAINEGANPVVSRPLAGAGRWLLLAALALLVAGLVYLAGNVGAGQRRSPEPRPALAPVPSLTR
jgi:hypothetical protein